jgi:hypothetical protein
MGMNGLTHAQTERIGKLCEEMGESLQCIGKVLLHGYHVEYQGVVYNNKSDLERELGDVAAAMRLMTRSGDLSSVAIAHQRRAKLATITRYMAHQALSQMET